MGLLKNLFRSSAPAVLKTGNVLDLFPEFDFKLLPDEEWVVLTPDSDGTRRCVPRKDPKELIQGVFCSIAIRWFKTGEKNVHLTNDNIGSVTEGSIRDLVNNLFKTMGKDNLKCGAFDESDARALKDGFWTGRNYNSDVSPTFSVAMMGDEWSMTISLNERTIRIITIQTDQLYRICSTLTKNTNVIRWLRFKMKKGGQFV